jgi:hypothetical protein
MTARIHLDSSALLIRLRVRSVLNVWTEKPDLVEAPQT